MVSNFIFPGNAFIPSCKVVNISAVLFWLFCACAFPRYIPFVFAGKGELENEVNSADNIKNVGFKTGDELRNIIEKALFTVLPAEWSENCPFSVMESQSLMTPVLGAKIGGIPELIDDGKTGILFESGNLKELTEKIEYLYNNKELCRQMSENCRDIKYDTIKEYSEKLIKLYKEVTK